MQTLSCFVQSQAKLVELQDRLRVYNQASNAKINYGKSVAFPLHGGKTKDSDGQQVQNYVTTRLNIKWYDSHSTGYIKYLGYPIWFATHQRDAFVAELLGAITSMTTFYGSRLVSLYGKVNIANTLILSKLWHVIRVVSLPQKNSVYNLPICDVWIVPATEGHCFLSSSRPRGTRIDRYRGSTKGSSIPILTSAAQ